MHEVTGCVRKLLLILLAALAWGAQPAMGQLATGYRPIEKPGIYGVRVHPGALAPNRRKWFLPQNLYYEYRWRGWEYSNYARDDYQRYVNILLEGTRHYDPFGNYIGRGWRLYDWTENQPQRQGSTIFKSPNYENWFNRLMVSSANKGQMYTSLTIGDAIRTTMTPLTFSKPTFNGLQWDLLSDKYAVTLLASRLSGPGAVQFTQSQTPLGQDNTSRFLGARGVAHVGDFAKVGATWLNSVNTRSDLTLGDNSLKGVLTSAQNNGNVEAVTIRISDDSPESADSGALLFFDRVIIDGQIHSEIAPIVRGGVQKGSSLEAKGVDQIELIYNLRDSFLSTERTPTLAEAESIEFEMIVANDYLIEVTSNMQLDREDDPVFLPVARADGETKDGSNQRFVRFDYGLPTGNEVVGVDVDLFDLGGLQVRAEYALNRRFQRFPNQNFLKLPVATERASASYLTASYTEYPWFAYGEAFSMDPDYSSSAFMGDSRGEIDYSDEKRHLFEFVDDNDDQDRFADWERASQIGSTLGLSVGFTGQDREVFPGLDENNDFVSDFNQNDNTRPDYAEPFLRYNVDAPEFLFGMDINNNTIIDRFEDDRAPDYPYEKDHRGYNVYGGARLTEDVQVTVGRLSEDQISSDRRSRATYGLFTGTWRFPGLDISLFEKVKFVKDNIREDRVVWVDPTGMTDFTDPLVNQDTFVNSFYATAEYTSIPNLAVSGKLKQEHFVQRGDEEDVKRNHSFLGLINKADYRMVVSEAITFWPKWKSTFRRVVPTERALSTSRDLEETLFLVARYELMRGTWIDFGVELSRFENLKKRPTGPAVGFVDDFTSRVFSVLFSNTSAYLGYQLTMNAGVELQRQKLKEDTRKESLAFIRVFAATGAE